MKLEDVLGRLQRELERDKTAVSPGVLFVYREDMIALLAELERAHKVVRAASELVISGNMYAFSDAFTSKEGVLLELSVNAYDAEYK